MLHQISEFMSGKQLEDEYQYPILGRVIYVGYTVEM